MNTLAWMLGALRRAGLWFGGASRRVVAAALLLGLGLHVAAAQAQTLRIDNAIAAEGDEYIDFIVRLNPTAATTVYFDFATVDGTAKAGAHYHARNGHRVAVPARASSHPVRIRLTDAVRADRAQDTLIRQFKVVLSNPQPFIARLQGGGASITAVGSIIDDDAPPTPSYDSADVYVNPAAHAVDPGDTITQTYTLWSNGGFSHDVLGVVPGSRWTGEIWANRGLSSGERCQTRGSTVKRTKAGLLRVAGAVMGDRSFGGLGPQRRCTYQVSHRVPANARPGVYRNKLSNGNNYRITINGPRLSIADVTVAEGNTVDGDKIVVDLPITLTEAAPAGGLTFRYATMDGTAKAGRDYTTHSGVATITGGSSGWGVRVPIRRDDTELQPPRQFYVVISDLGPGVSFGFEDGTATAVTATVTINDNVGTPAEITISDAVVEEDAEYIDFPVRVTPSNPRRTVEWDFTTEDGPGATVGVEYISASGTTRIFADGRGSNVRVHLTDQIRADAYRHGTRQFKVRLSNPMHGYFPGGADSITATGTIVDDDLYRQPEMSIRSSQQRVATGNDALFVVDADAEIVTALFGQQVPIQLSQPDGGDFLDTSPTAVTFGAGSTTATLTVATKSGAEGAGTVTATLTAGNAYAPYRIAQGKASAGVFVFNDSETPVVGVSAEAGITEGEPLRFHLSAAPRPKAPLTVQVRLGGADGFVATRPATVTFAADASSVTYSVATTDDTTHEADATATFTVEATTDYSYYLNQDPTVASAVITDNDTPQIDFSSATAVTVAEGTSAAITLSATPAPYKALTVALESSQSGGVTIPHNAVFAAGATTATAQIGVIEDNQIDEPDRMVDVTLRGETAATGSHVDDEYFLSTAATPRVITYADNDDPPRVTLDGDAEASGGRDLLFSVTLNAPSGRTVTVDYKTSDDTAMAGVDYTSNTGTLTFLPGERSGEVLVATMRGDGGEKSMRLHLSNPHAASLVATFAEGKISEKPAVFIIANTQRVRESEGEAVFTIKLTAPPPGDIDLPVSATVEQEGNFIADGTHDRAVTFSAGRTSATLTVAIDDDNISEGDGAVTAKIIDNFMTTDTMPEPYIVDSTAGSATIVIEDDDGAVISATGYRVGEGGRLLFTVRLDASSNNEATVRYRTNGSPTPGATATVGQDYHRDIAGTLTFAPGETVKILGVRSVIDSMAEPNGESVILTLFEPVNAHFRGHEGGAGRITATGWILDKATRFSVRVAPASSGVRFGRTARFEVIAPAPALAPTPVVVTVSQTGDVVVREDLGARVVTLATGASRAAFEVRTVASGSGGGQIYVAYGDAVARTAVFAGDPAQAAQDASANIAMTTHTAAAAELATATQQATMEATRERARAALTAKPRYGLALDGRAWAGYLARHLGRQPGNGAVEESRAMSAAPDWGRTPAIASRSLADLPALPRHIAFAMPLAGTDDTGAALLT